MENKYKLSLEQKKVVLGTEKIRKVIACAGSGKTSVLTASIIELLRKGKCLPSEILALTFTKNAAVNMRVRISREISSSIDADMIDIYTFNSFGNLIVKENSYLFGLSKDFFLLDEAKSWQLVFEIFKNSEFEYLKVGKNIAQFTNRILGYIWDLKNNLIDIDQIKDYLNNFESILQSYKSESLRNEEYEKLNYLQEISKIYIEYEKIKTSQNYIDYADQIFLPYKLFSKSIAAKEKYSQKYKYIFVDEFQDTNNSQAFFLSKVFNPHYNNIMIVGDDDQGIYGFRGACIENIIDMQYFDSDMVFGLKPYLLTVNFRSGEKIIDFANNVISNNKNRHLKIAKPEYTGKASEVFFFQTRDVKEESMYIAQMISKLKEEGVMLKDIAILCRKKQFNEIIKSLRQTDIKYEFIGNKNLFYENEILFLVSWLKLINNIYDEESLVYLLKSSRYKICDRDIYFLRYYIKNINKTDKNRIDNGSYYDYGNSIGTYLIEAIKTAKQNVYITRNCAEKLLVFIEDLEYYTRKSEQYNLSGIINLIFHHSGLYEEINSRFGHSIKKKIRNVETLIKIASSFEKDDSNANFESFVLYLKELAKTEIEDPDNIEISADNSVKIMSIHAAKGLEFQVVFLPMLWDKDYKPRLSSKTEFELPAYLRTDSKIWSEKPLYSSASKFKDMLKERLREEERRIFYVGASRAKKLLVLSYPLYKDFKDNKEEKPNALLEFIKEGILPEKQIENIKDEFEQILKNIDFNDYHYKNEKKRERRNIGKKRQKINLSDKTHISMLEHLLAKQIFYLNKDYNTFIKEKGEVICHDKDNDKEKFLTLTEILTYMNCPKLYEYKYIINIPEDRRKDNTAFGTKLHSLIAWITKQLYEGYRSSNKNSTEIYMDFSSILNKCLKEISSIKEPKLKMCLMNFIKSGLTNFKDIDKIFLEKLIYWKFNDFFIRCQVDRIDLIENDFLRIYDYKSGTKKESSTDFYYKNQISFYVLAVSDYFKVPVEKIHSFIFYLESGEMDQIIIDDFQKENICDTLNDAVNEVFNKNNHTIVKHAKKCAACSFSSVCR